MLDLSSLGENIINLPVVEWLEHHRSSTIMVNDGQPCGVEKCFENGGDLRTCTC